MGALRPSLENVRRLELKLGQIPRDCFLRLQLETKIRLEPPKS
jgi:hypothetical protein